MRCNHIFGVLGVEPDIGIPQIIGDDDDDVGFGTGEERGG
jgi:hypothetical protein